MKAAYLIKTKVIEYRDIPTPEPGDGEVLVKITHVGLCGSDVHYYEHGRIGSFIVEKPIILGHESAGEIVKVGRSVKDFKTGDRVTIEPGVPCGKCQFCRSGNYNLCPDVIFMATPPYDGAFAEYVAYPADMLVKLPDNVSNVEGALVEPLCVGLHAANLAGATVGHTAAVLGCGCIGLVTVMALKARGVSCVYATDTIDIRLDKANAAGANFTLDAKSAQEKILEMTDGEGVDFVFEAAGNKYATGSTPYICKRGGTIVLIGLTPEGKIEYDFGEIMSKELAIKSVFRYRNLYKTGVNAIASGKIDVKNIVSHVFNFSELQKAIEFNINNKDEVSKIVIEM